MKQGGRTLRLLVRLASKVDLPAIVELFGDDAGFFGDDAGFFGDDAAPSPVVSEHTSLGQGQLDAFDTIAADPNNQVYVAEQAGRVVGTFQLTFIRQLSYGGCLVAQVESVHVHSSQRSRGIGRAMMNFAIAEARRRSALRIQLTSNVRRTRAHHFYERLGFEASHRGMKLFLR